MLRQPFFYVPLKSTFEYSRHQGPENARHNKQTSTVSTVTRTLVQRNMAHLNLEKTLVPLLLVEEAMEEEGEAILTLTAENRTIGED